jgi:hypothetical protein
MSTEWMEFPVLLSHDATQPVGVLRLRKTPQTLALTGTHPTLWQLAGGGYVENGHFSLREVSFVVTPVPPARSGA